MTGNIRGSKPVKMTTWLPAACRGTTASLNRAASTSTSAPRRMSLPPAASPTRSGAMATARGTCSSMTWLSSFPERARFAYPNPGCRAARTSATRSAQPRYPPAGYRSFIPSVKLSPRATKEPIGAPGAGLVITSHDAIRVVTDVMRPGGQTGGMSVPYVSSPAPSFLFDLDGTLIDSVYQHVIAWRSALTDLGVDLSVWRSHRRLGMSG